MTTTTFPASKLTALRRKAYNAARLPQNVPQGWSVSPVGPAGILAVFDALRLKPGYVLRAFQFREGDNGNGFIWAVPVDSSLPDPNACPRLEGVFLDPPNPPDALDDYMDAIEGDGSPWSYVQASILARQLADFGAMWHGCDWDTHTILGGDFLKPGAKPAVWATDKPSGDPKDWQWMEPKPRRWKPSATVGEAAVTVVFYTFSALGQQTIYRHTDTFKPDLYRFETDRVAVAAGPGGFVF